MCVRYHRPSLVTGKDLVFSCYWSHNKGCESFNYILFVEYREISQLCVFYVLLGFNSTLCILRTIYGFKSTSCILCTFYGFKSTLCILCILMYSFVFHSHNSTLCIFRTCYGFNLTLCILHTFMYFMVSTQLCVFCVFIRF